MPPNPKLQSLLTAAGNAAREEEAAAARIAAGVAWVKEVVAALFTAQERVQDAWDRIFDALPEDLSDEEVDALPEPPEQAELDALHAQIDAVIERDQWPRELYWSL